MYSRSVPWFFFFQAEDGIRDTSVTGVQTCALPHGLQRLRRNEIETAVPSGTVGSSDQAGETVCHSAWRAQATTRRLRRRAARRRRGARSTWHIGLGTVRL